MTPKEKAEEITFVYYNLGKHLYVPISFAKQCALIAVDEIISEFYLEEDVAIYWQEVKQEIENL
jgi:hypothetical protein